MGEGTALGPEIQHPVPKFAEWVVRHGRKNPSYPAEMPMYTVDQLPDGDLNAILAFLATPPRPTTGAGLYKDFCANCHGPAGKAVMNHDISTKTAEQFIQHVDSGHHAGDYGNRTGYMPSRKQKEWELSDAEITLIHAYVRGL
jgi:mono/diheme cytochrome c family protein